MHKELSKIIAYFNTLIESGSEISQVDIFSTNQAGKQKRSIFRLTRSLEHVGGCVDDN